MNEIYIKILAGKGKRTRCWKLPEEGEAQRIKSKNGGEQILLTTLKGVSTETETALRLLIMSYICYGISYRG